MFSFSTEKDTEVRHEGSVKGEVVEETGRDLPLVIIPAFHGGYSYNKEVPDSTSAVKQHLIKTIGSHG
jgi:hypothetical protein